MVQSLTQSWQYGNAHECCALAVALVAWVSQMRLGELLPARSSGTDCDRLPAQKAWSSSEGAPTASEIFLPWTKSTAYKCTLGRFCCLECIQLSLTSLLSSPTSLASLGSPLVLWPGVRLYARFRDPGACRPPLAPHTRNTDIGQSWWMPNPSPHLLSTSLSPLRSQPRASQA
jgi:hypothetical protein